MWTNDDVLYPQDLHSHCDVVVFNVAHSNSLSLLLHSWGIGNHCMSGPRFDTAGNTTHLRWMERVEHEQKLVMDSRKARSRAVRSSTNSSTDVPIASPTSFSRSHGALHRPTQHPPHPLSPGQLRQATEVSRSVASISAATHTQGSILGERAAGSPAAALRRNKIENQVSNALSSPSSTGSLERRLPMSAVTPASSTSTHRRLSALERAMSDTVVSQRQLLAEVLELKQLLLDVLPALGPSPNSEKRVVFAPKDNDSALAGR